MPDSPKTVIRVELPAAAAAKLLNVHEDAKRGDPAAVRLLADAASNGTPLVEVRPAEQTALALGDAPVTAAAGWQLHPSTKTAHFFPDGSRVSLCKRERRTTGPVQEKPGVFPCTLCSRRAST